MHGQKKRRKRTVDGTVEIDGFTLHWELISEPQWTTDGPKGLCVSVRRADGAYREMVIEYPYDRSAFVPQRPKLNAAIVETDIREAINDGWNPESRGRPFVFIARTPLALGKRSPGQLKHLPD